LLHSESPSVRRAAIYALALYWRVSPGSDYAIAVREVLNNEKCPEVRRQAFWAIGAIHAGTDDVEVGALLARTVVDDSEDVGTRQAAYEGLRFLRWKLEQALGPRCFPECVDWSFVERFLRTPRAVEPIRVEESIPQVLSLPFEKKHKDMVKAQSYLDSGMHAEAERLATELLHAELEAHERVFVHVLRAEARIELGAARRAIPDLSAAIELDPGHSNAYRIRSRAYEMLGDIGRASEDARRAQKGGA
jgi:tetratricopeptide (TPR) repeat protein